ncbi:MAG: hypothetical protein RLZZ139_3981, partial [Cyanobacteriota bacterium]
PAKPATSYVSLPTIVLGQKQHPRREWRRSAPPFSSWVLCPHTLGDSYIDNSS